MRIPLCKTRDAEIETDFWILVDLVSVVGAGGVEGVAVQLRRLRHVESQGAGANLVKERDRVHLVNF